MLVLGISLFAFSAVQTADEMSPVSEAQARELFAEYDKRGLASDPAEADVHCEDGRIIMFQEDESGHVRRLEGSAARYKEILRASAAEARQAGDYSTLSDVTFHRAGSGIRVEATRYSMARKYESPATFLISHCGTGEIGIMEMTVHTKPAPK